MAVVSPVPDLIFEDQRSKRVQDIAPYLDVPGEIDDQLVLHRITVFVTYGCNLACPYCKTIVRDRSELEARPQRAVTFDLDRFRALLESHSGTRIAHLHFTGGEASLHRRLPEMVRLARSRGVERVSMTTNGTASIERYVGAVDAGLDELRISVDAADAELGRRMTLRDGAWERSIDTLARLVELRARRAIPQVYLIANTVVSLSNASDVPRIVRLLLATGADDVKLITEVGSKETLPIFLERDSIRAEVQALLDDSPPESHPLLRRKLETVFSPTSIGLDRVVGRPDFRCYIPLTERTVDGVYYYPCSVYLREGGAPLGRIDEAPGLQREKTASFVGRGDCLTDPICKSYCLYCTREYNVAANAARSDR